MTRPMTAVLARSLPHNTRTICYFGGFDDDAATILVVGMASNCTIEDASLLSLSN
jgi:hypothetical protein